MVDSDFNAKLLQEIPEFKGTINFLFLKLVPWKVREM